MLQMQMAPGGKSKSAFHLVDFSGKRNKVHHELSESDMSDDNTVPLQVNVICFEIDIEEYTVF